RRRSRNPRSPLPQPAPKHARAVRWAGTRRGHRATRAPAARSWPRRRGRPRGCRPRTSWAVRAYTKPELTVRRGSDTRPPGRLYLLRASIARHKDLMTAAFASEYRVELPTFRGPLDLLLYLVKKHEVDILDIPIAVIASSYLAYLEVLQLIDIEATGNFLVMASTLMEIKSRMMLPASEDEEEAEQAGEQKIDPRAELVKQLVAYRRYREAAEDLERLAAKQTSR